MTPPLTEPHNDCEAQRSYEGKWIFKCMCHALKYRRLLTYLFIQVLLHRLAPLEQNDSGNHQGATFRPTLV